MQRRPEKSTIQVSPPKSTAPRRAPSPVVQFYTAIFALGGDIVIDPDDQIRVRVPDEHDDAARVAVAAFEATL